MNDASAITLEVPKQDLRALSFCAADVDSVATWVSSLPMANLGNTTKNLYDALGELNRLELSPQNRYEILEKIRPALHYALDGIQKHYLNKPVILPPQPLRVAKLSNALVSRLVDGYRIVITQCQGKLTGFSLGKKPTLLMACACYRAIIESRPNLIRTYQLYRPVPENFWHDIHQVFMLARTSSLLDIDLSDRIEAPAGIHKLTVLNAYLSINLLGCTKANQLRQDDIPRVATKIDEWTSLAHLKKTSQQDDQTFIVDPLTDSPPMYQKFYHGDFNDKCLKLDTFQLTEYIKQEADPQLSQNATGLSHNLLSHLVIAWGVLSDRTFMRLETSDELAISFGLTCSHYFLSDGLEFEQLIRSEEEVGLNETRLFDTDVEGNRKVNDPWGSIAGGSNASTQAANIELDSINYHIRRADSDSLSETADDKEKYNDFQAMMINISPGGYCLEWPDGNPPQIKTGDIISIKEKHHSAWSIGAIRWVRQSAEGAMRMGIELLSPHASPYGARAIVQGNEHNSSFMRVILLPEIKTIGQPMTLITPAVSFKEDQKVVLVQRGRETMAKLGRKVAATGSYFQFEFEPAKQLLAASDDPGSEPHFGFDSVWNNL